MAIPSNDFTTYDAIGNREDLIDVISNIAPVDTWFTSNTGSGKATARYHEWQKDTLAAAAANAQIEGNTKTATAITPTTRTGNYTQIISKEFMVTETQETVDKAGRASEVAYQTTKAMKELARDIEYALLINATAVSGDTATARQLKGVLGWLTTNVTTGTGTGTQVLTASMLNDNLQLIWAQGGKPKNVLCGAFQKRTISGFTTPITRNVDAAQRSYTDAIDIYDSNFGKLYINLHHILNTTAADVVVILGDMSLWKKAWLRPIKKKEMPIASFSTFYSIEAELTLESRQEAGSGKITELTTS